MFSRFLLVAFAMTLVTTHLPVDAHAQDSSDTVRPVSGDGSVALGVSARAVFEQSVSLHLDNVSLKSALSALADKAGVRILYSSDQLPVDKVISLVTDQITVGDALRVLLHGTGFVASVSAPGRVVLERATTAGVMGRRDQQGTATLYGSVTDSGTGATISQVTVHIDGTSLSVKSSADGQYKFTNIAAGEYRVTARRVGYLAKTRTITVNDGQAATLDFGLNPPATKLNEVVTTALGEQRRYEVGNVIATVNVDSIAPTVPATSVTDILSGRVPGVEIIENSGIVGGGESIRIRGQASLLLQSDPIIIVDGIRVDNAPGSSANGTIFAGQPSPSRINDLDFSQIETIDILKGPAATTEYGTDAANGVIVITTKRGVAGKPQWNASAEGTASSIPVGFPEFYTSWGQTTDGKARFTYCSLSTNSSFSGIAPNGNCVADSVSNFDPLNESQYTLYGTGPSSRYNLNVGGGSEAVRYMVAGTAGQATGVMRLPDVFRSEATALGYPGSLLDPNSLDQRSTHANTSIHMNAVTDVQLSVEYLSTYQQSPNEEDMLAALGDAPSLPDSIHNFGYGFNASNRGPGMCNGSCLIGTIDSPLLQIGQLNTTSTQRWTGGLQATWRPANWFAGEADAGVDHGSFGDQQIEYPQANYFGYGNFTSGQIQVANGTNDIYTVNLRGTITTTLFRDVKAMTSLGANYVDTRYNALYAIQMNLSPSSVAITEASNGNQSQEQDVTAGAYIEENFGIGDRCYVPVALRLDTGSGFGASVSEAGGAYPKWSLTCAVLNGATTLRIRAAYGAAGRQPPYGAALPLYASGVEAIGPRPGSVVPGYQLEAAGNDALKPERSTQTEAGMDLGLWNGRVSAEFSWYATYTTNMLWQQDLEWEIAQSYTENVGNLRNTGLEATVGATLVQNRTLTWSTNVITSINTNKLTRLAPGLLTTIIGPNQYFAAGYPLYGYWGYVDTYADKNGDGILESSEVTQSPTLTYMGSSIPRQETSWSTDIGLFRGILGVQALFDARGSFEVNEQLGLGPFYADENVPTSPLAQQAFQMAQNLYSVGGSLQFFDGAYVRFRELSLSFSVPRRWLHITGVRTIMLVGGVRNLALWTRFPYGDPEVSDVSNYTSVNAASNTYTPNNDVRGSGLSAVPLTRSFDLRLNVGL